MWENQQTESNKSNAGNNSNDTNNSISKNKKNRVPKTHSFCGTCRKLTNRTKNLIVEPMKQPWDTQNNTTESVQAADQMLN